jgi:hypothetical protein
MLSILCKVYGNAMKVGSREVMTICRAANVLRIYLALVICVYRFVHCGGQCCLCRIVFRSKGIEPLMTLIAPTQRGMPLYSCVLTCVKYSITNTVCKMKGASHYAKYILVSCCTVHCEIGKRKLYFLCRSATRSRWNGNIEYRPRKTLRLWSVLPASRVRLRFHLLNCCFL